MQNCSRLLPPCADGGTCDPKPCHLQGLRGVLCHGPPGTGKTFIMAALAAEARAHLEVCMGCVLVCGHADTGSDSSFTTHQMQMPARQIPGTLQGIPGANWVVHNAAAPALKRAGWVQVVDGAAVAAGTQAAQQLQRAFQRAKAHAPAVLFIDCLDALAPARHDVPSTACPLRCHVPTNIALNKVVMAVLHHASTIAPATAIKQAANQCAGGGSNTALRVCHCCRSSRHQLNQTNMQLSSQCAGSACQSHP